MDLLQNYKNVLLVVLAVVVIAGVVALSAGEQESEGEISNATTTEEETNDDIQHTLSEGSDPEEEGAAPQGSAGESVVESGSDGGEEPDPSRQGKAEVDPTANWRGYTNTSLGVGFKLPPEWNLNENSRPGSYTVQAYALGDEGKSVAFNVLKYEAELDADTKGAFSGTVNGRSAYTAASACASVDEVCTLRTVIFPLEDGEITDGAWRGSALRLTALVHTTATNAIKETIQNMIGTVEINP